LLIRRQMGRPLPFRLLSCDPNLAHRIAERLAAVLGKALVQG
jgi:hypothetical protein